MPVDRTASRATRQADRAGSQAARLSTHRVWRLAAAPAPPRPPQLLRPAAAAAAGGGAVFGEGALGSAGAAAGASRAAGAHAALRGDGGPAPGATSPSAGGGRRHGQRAVHLSAQHQAPWGSLRRQPSQHVAQPAVVAGGRERLTLQWTVQRTVQLSARCSTAQRLGAGSRTAVATAPVVALTAALTPAPLHRPPKVVLMLAATAQGRRLSCCRRRDIRLRRTGWCCRCRGLGCRCGLCGGLHTLCGAQPRRGPQGPAAAARSWLLGLRCSCCCCCWCCWWCFHCRGSHWRP